MLSSHKINHILGNCSEFYEQQTQRLLHLRLDVPERAVSHLAFRTETLAEYLKMRQQLEPFCLANVENVWGGRPISKLLLQTPLHLASNSVTRLIELIPPPHQDVYQGVYKLDWNTWGLSLARASWISEEPMPLSGQASKTKVRSASPISLPFPIKQL